MISDRQEAVIDRMLVTGYLTPVIAEVAEVSRGTVGRRRAPLVSGGALGECQCICGATIWSERDGWMWWRDDHNLKACPKRYRRSQKLLAIVRKQRRDQKDDEVSSL